MSFPTYAHYKDSGVEWLGEVPAHWEMLPLKRISPSQTVGIVVNPSEYISDDGLPFIYGGDISEGQICYENSRRISQVDSEKNKKTKLSTGDVLVVRVGAPGVAAVVPSECEGGNCASVMLIRKGNYCSDWLCYLFNSRVVRYQVEIVQYGAAQEQFNIAHAVEFIMPTPSFNEQKKIAGYLHRETTKLDALITEQRTLIDLLKEKRQAVISHAVTKGLDAGVAMKDSGVEWLGEVPAHWELHPLKHVADFRSGGTPDKGNIGYWNGDIPWASAKDLKVDDLFDTADHITEAAVLSGVASLVPAKSILVVVRGMILARIFPVVMTQVPMAINQDLKAVIPGEHIHADYMAWLLRGSESETLSRLDEAGHGTKALRMDAWGAMKMPVPSVDEQKEIVTFINEETTRLDALTAEAQTTIALLQERRSALISAAVTGKIDVRQAA